MAAALRVPVEQLIPGGDDELVELGDGAMVSPRWIREMLTGELYRDRHKKSLVEMPYAQFPAQKVLAEVMHRMRTEDKRVQALTAPILEWAEKHDAGLTPDDWDALFERASDTEQHAARRLDVDVTAVKLSARILWDHREFDDERDRRVGDIDELEPRSRQARRGLVTREMLAELRVFLEEAYAGQERDGDGER